MIELLMESAREIGIEINKDQAEKFILYKDILLEWNKKMNLTAITDERDIILKHFIDSISVLKLMHKKHSKAIDIGTGAGFPGIPISILNHSCDMTLMDSLLKRIHFLNEVVDKLELKNCTTIHDRAEVLAHNPLFRERYDYAFSRAVAPLYVLVEYALPFLKTGGVFFALKGSKAEQEVSEAKISLQKLGAQVSSIELIHIPNTDICHSIIIISKLHEGLTIYPRKQALITKSPLK